MDAYVAAFPAIQHGYRMRIGNSQLTSSAVTQYECYRSGYPPASAAPNTKSARIGCPFEMKTQYIYKTSSWILFHTHLGHNHPADPKVTTRQNQKPPNTLPILAPGVRLDDDTDSTPLEQQAISHNLIPPAQPSIPASPPQTYYDVEDDIQSLESIETTISQLRAQLLAIRPHCRQDVLNKIQTVISNAGIFNNEGTLATITNMDDDRLLPKKRTDAIARLATSKSNVVSDQEHWLSMPSWGGIIATTFNCPVLYYKPGAYSQLVFPYSTFHNLNPPIVLAWADHHFTSLLLDFTRPNFPAPRVCATWRRFHKPEASSWYNAWESQIESHAEFLKAVIKSRHKRKPQEISLLD